MSAIKPVKEPLSVTHPNLAKEWDIDKNAPLSPNDVTSGSHKKVWWKCSKGHVWDEVVSNRTSRNSGCVYCSNHRVLAGYNDLYTLRPDLAKEWNYEKNTSLSPDQVTVGVSTKVWWKCSQGHSWNARISSRTIGSGCPYCAGKYAITGINDLKTTNPELIKEWNYGKNDIKPTEVLSGSSRKVWWKCDKGHEWEATIDHRASRGDSCPYCSGHKVLPGFNDLATLHPDLAKEWNYNMNTPLTPKEVTAGSGQKVWWIGKCGHEWEAAVGNRVKGSGCPYCSGQKALIGFNDFASQYPKLVQEWNYEKNSPLTPEMFTAGSGKKVWWKCNKGHEWLAAICNRSNSTGCPICANNQLLIGFNDLITLNPDIASEWNYEKNDILPTEVKSGSNKKVWWKCSKNHEWVARISERTSRNNGCPYCSGHRVLLGFNDLATTRPELTIEWDYEKNGSLSPKEVTTYSQKIVWWKCSHGHEWKAPISRRSSRGDSCPYCSGRYAIKGETDLQTKYPNVAKEWDYEKNAPLTPKDVTSGSSKKFWWKCDKGHSFHTTISHRTSKNSGCPFCSGHAVLPGFNDLASQYPNLVNEWDYEKNYPLTPKDVTTKSGKKAWWIGKCGHSWDAVIATRSSGAGCPYCSNPPKLVLAGFNDLQTKYPQIATEWHPTKNGLLKPTDVTPMAHELVWWLGKCGHEWQATVQNRSGGNGCPFCAGRRVLIGFNDLKSRFPLIAKEWHTTKNGDLLPSQVTYGSGIKVWWKCSACGNEWKADIASRTNGNGCPTCANEKQTSFPEQAVYYYLSKKFTAINRYNDGNYELDVFLPDINVGIEYDGAFFHDVESVKIRDKKKNKHFKDNGIRLIRIKEDSKNAISDDVVSYKVNSNYNQLSWAIEQTFSLIDHSVQIPSIDIDRDQGNIHEQYILSEKENSLAAVYPELVTEWNYEKNIIDPSRVSSKSGKRVWWKCPVCGNEWQTSISHRANGRSCPECAKKIRAAATIKTKLEKNGSFQDAFPEIAKEWHPTLNGNLQPKNILAGSGIRVWWKCSVCGNEWLATPSGRAQGTGCPECGKQKSVSSRKVKNLVNKGSLDENYPELAREWHSSKNDGLLPTDVVPGSRQKVWWTCSVCKHEWQAAICDRVRGTGCPSCADRARIETRIKREIERKGSLLDNNPSIAAEWNYLRNGSIRPEDVMSYSHEKAWWIGKCGHEWEDNVSNRTSRNAGCPYCSNHRVLAGYNDLLSKNPQLASEWNYEKNDIKPSEVTPNSGKKVWWKCSKGHEWESVIYSRAKGSKCPICSNRQVLPGTNDLATTNPELCKEWDYEKNELKPTDILPGYYKKVWWVCSVCGFEWETEVRLRVKGSGCPLCGHYKVTKALSKPVKCVETGITYASANEAARQTKISQGTISACCNEKQESAGGYHWEYINE